MTRAYRFLLVASMMAVGTGAATVAAGLLGTPLDAAPLGPLSASTALVITGVVVSAIGFHGFHTWTRLPTATRADRWLLLADRHAVCGEPEYARTYYEEALRAGADPEVVVPRLLRCERKGAS